MVWRSSVIDAGSGAESGLEVAGAALDGSALDLAAPGAGLAPARLDELLELLQVSLDAALDDAQLVADLLDHPLWLIADHGGDPRAVRAGGCEADDAGVLRAAGAAPTDLLIGDLVGDHRVPLFRLAGDRCAPVQSRIVELTNFLDPLHEPGELFELCPLVVDGTYRQVDFNRLFYARHLCPLSLFKATSAA